MQNFDSFASSYLILTDTESYYCRGLAYPTDLYPYKNMYKNYIIKPEEQYRPDKIAYNLWGNQYSSWILDLINNFTHGIQEYYMGRQIQYLESTVLNKLGMF